MSFIPLNHGTVVIIMQGAITYTRHEKGIVDVGRL